MHLLLLALLSAGSASAATVEWSPGMGLSLYAQTQTLDLQCPATDIEARDNTGLCQAYMSADGKVLCDRNIPNSDSSRFLNTNGFADSEGPLTFGTHLKAVNADSPTGGGCWALGSNSEVGSSPCKFSDSNQKLYIVHREGGDGSFYIYTDVNAVPLAVGNGAITARDIPPLIFCIYDSDSGRPVALPTSGPSYFNPKILTNLTGAALPGSDNPQPEFALPGCSGESPLGESPPVDCLIARAVNGMPADCAANPGKRACVLHLVAAFCFDIPLWRAVGDHSAQVEACFRSVALGPCVANPGGAACISGQFAGIAEFGRGGSPGGRQNTSMTSQVLRRADPGPLFSDEPNQLPAEDQFFVGMMKNLLNGIIDLVNLFRDSMFQSSHISCLAMTTRFPDQDKEAGARIRAGCGELFKPHAPIKNIPLDGDIEKAGSVFADVVSLLFAATDVAKAVQASKFVGGIKTVLAKFKPRPLTAGEGIKGMVIEATEGPNTIQIFRDAGDGKPMGLYTQRDFDALQQSIADEAFDNCKTCISPPVKIKRGAHLYPRGLIKKLCCFMNPRTLEAPEEYWQSSGMPETSIPGAPEPPRTVGDLLNPAGHNDDGNILQGMANDFKAWYSARASVPLATDATTTTWVKRVAAATTKDGLAQVRSDFIAANNLDTTDVRAFTWWMDFYQIDLDGLHTGMPKMPPTTGIVFRGTDLSTETANVFIEGLQGPISKGERGIYEVQDMVLNVVSNATPSGDYPRLVMSTSLAYQFDYDFAALYRFVINSRTGRYITPFRPQFNQKEVVFVQGVSGKFKIIGYQPLNGGETARLAGQPGPYGVFYFDEIAA